MAWIESHQSLKDHPKLYAVCRTLDAKREHMVGHLMCLWWWCIDYAMDGDISKFSANQIASASGWEKDPTEYLKALISSGFIDRNEKSMQIHDWLDFCGDMMLKRLERLSAKRRRTADIVPQTAKNGALPILSNPTNPTTADKKRPPTFTKPSVQEIEAYCKERRNSVNPQKFFNFYESKGWVVGRAPMRNWKACVRTWENDGFVSNKERLVI